jgi:hypothetical protein
MVQEHGVAIYQKGVKIIQSRKLMNPNYKGAEERWIFSSAFAFLTRNVTKCRAKAVPLLTLSQWCWPIVDLWLTRVFNNMLKMRTLRAQGIISVNQGVVGSSPSWSAIPRAILGFFVSWAFTNSPVVVLSPLRFESEQARVLRPAGSKRAKLEHKPILKRLRKSPVNQWFTGLFFFWHFKFVAKL